jgi:hypothetical protein
MLKKGSAAAPSLPLVVPLEKDWVDQASDGGFVWNDSDDIDVAFDVPVQADDRIDAVQLRAMLSGKGKIGENILLAGVPELGGLGPAPAELTRDMPPGFTGKPAVGLVERVADRGERSQSGPSAAPSSLANGRNHNLLRSRSSFRVGLSGGNATGFVMAAPLNVKGPAEARPT